MPHANPPPTSTKAAAPSASLAWSVKKKKAKAKKRLSPTLPAPAFDAKASPSWLLSAPPSTGFPDVPRGFTKVPGSDFLGYHPTTGELSVAPRAIDELRAFARDLEALGPSVPACNGIADALSRGIEWRVMRERAERWCEFARVQDGLAWKAAVTELNKLKEVFLIARAHRPALVENFPALARMFDAPTAIAKRSAATRLRRAKAKASALDPAAAAAAGAGGSAESAAAGSQSGVGGSQSGAAGSSSVAATPAAVGGALAGRPTVTVNL
jgi:hypothetical protein